MLHRLIRFLDQHHAIRRGELSFTIRDFVGSFPDGFTADMEPTRSEYADYKRREERWENRNITPARELLRGLCELGYVQANGSHYRLFPNAYRWLKVRAKKAAASS